MTSKYKNRPTGGYASKKEYNLALALQALNRAGRITAYQEQVKYELLPKMGNNRAVKYILDFQYLDKQDQRMHYIDVKGFRTEVYRLKKKLMLAVHGIEIEEV